jgi:hypothetical protein
MAEKKKTTKPRQKATLNLEETAEYLGITVEELMQSRGRGLSPGKDGYKKDGTLVWDRKSLPAKDEAVEEQ